MNRLRNAVNEGVKRGLKLEAIEEVLQVFQPSGAAKKVTSVKQSASEMRSVVPVPNTDVEVAEEAIVENTVEYDFSDENKLIEVCKFFCDYSYTHNFFISNYCNRF